MVARRRPVSGAAMACAAVAVTAALAAGPVASADTLLWTGGTGGSLGSLLPPDLFGTPDTFLAGAYVDHQFTVVPYPSGFWPVTGLHDPTLGRSVDIGTTNLVAAATSTPGPLVLAGVSQGAMVVQQAQALLNTDPAIPSDTTFILIADPNLGLGKRLHGVYLPIIDYTPRPPVDTRFNTIVITNQYDGFGEPIANPRNLLTVVNAVMGTAYVHPFAQNSDLAAVPPGNITTTVNSQGGTTTSYLVPTQQLPLTRPLRKRGVPDAVVDAIDAVLRPIIDAGYAPSSTPVSAQARRLSSSRRTPGAPVSASARTADSSSPRAATGTSGRHSPMR